ncbi:MAG: carbamoyl-phosphate synthase large subunit [Hydrogenibacillus sp.]|nr:carbamoyl-phosphate synthase large subunit [Hydrogenibacillus sp.]
MTTKVLVIGSGPIVIGQAAEFDYAGTQACLALKEEGVHVVLVNNNPATIMTDPEIADTVYIEPLTAEAVAAIIARERPDGLIATLGGQTGLNLAVELERRGVLQAYGVRLLGTTVETIQNGEDRERFRRLMVSIGEPVVESATVSRVEDGLAFAEAVGYPVILRPAYTLGGEGGGFAENAEALRMKLALALKQSPIRQVLIEKSIRGWYEIEYEVVRDAGGHIVIVTTMENVDPVGVHTGDSIVVAPAMTLPPETRRTLDRAATRIARAMRLVGAMNIQFAVSPAYDAYAVIEVNPRVSRSSALASKATGYPIARAAAKLALGLRLSDIPHPLLKGVTLAEAPDVRYAVVKVPRFPFDVFPEATPALGSQMQSTGEAMGIDRTYIGALHKALRALGQDVAIYDAEAARRMSEEALMHALSAPTHARMTAVFYAFFRRMSVESVAAASGIHPFFLRPIEGAVRLAEALLGLGPRQLPSDDAASRALIQQAKAVGMSDRALAKLLGADETVIRRWRHARGIRPRYVAVDPSAGRAKVDPRYVFATYDDRRAAETDSGHQTARETERRHPVAGGAVDDRATPPSHESAVRCDVHPLEGRKALVVGSGAIRIGQGIEFDYAAVHAVFALKKRGRQVIVINHNPETVSTDYALADRLYFEPITAEDVLEILEQEGKDLVEGSGEERAYGDVHLMFGGQTSINLYPDLSRAGVHAVGYTDRLMEAFEARAPFYALLDELGILHPPGRIADSAEGLVRAAAEVGYPVIVRPSYVIGGEAMRRIDGPSALRDYIARHRSVLDDGMPLLVDRFIDGIEFEVDLVADGTDVYIPGFFEHVEPAGVHSGDSHAFFPARTLSEALLKQAADYARRIVRHTGYRGLMNIQYVTDGEHVYVLEVNPRSSRTVPIAGKLVGVSLIDLAVGALYGEPLPAGLPGAEAALSKSGAHAVGGPVAVKAPIFSTEKLDGATFALGPMMRATGEVLGIGATKSEALAKATLFRRRPSLAVLGEGDLAVIVADRGERTKLAPFIERCARRGARIAVFDPTSVVFDGEVLRRQGLTENVDETRDVPNDVPLESVQWLIAPTVKSDGALSSALQALIRAAVVRGVPTTLSVEAALIAAELTDGTPAQTSAVRPLSEITTAFRAAAERVIRATP